MRQYPMPKTEQEFERFCVEFLRRYWKNPGLELYAKRGEEQHGVDIVDTTNPLDARAAQCKLREPTKNLQPAEVVSEVRKALSFPQPIQQYAICTTAKKSALTQDRVMEINAEHRKKGLFGVQIIYWDEIEAYLDRDQDLVDMLALASNASVRTVIRDEQAPLVAGLTSLRLSVDASIGNTFDTELDRAKSLLDRYERRGAEALLLELKSRAEDRLSPLQKFRCLTMLAAIEFNKGKAEDAAKLFIDAYGAYPQHERALANFAHAEFLRGHQDRAWELAQEAFNNHPNSAHTAAAYVTFAPGSVSAQALVSALSKDVLQNPQVVCALAHRYLVDRCFEDAIAWARRVDEDADCGHYALLNIGRALVERGSPEESRDAPRTAEQRWDLREAATVFGHAAARAEARGERHLAIEARVRQLDAADRSGDMEVVDAAIEDGLRVADGIPMARSQFLLARSQVHSQHGDFARALRDAEKALELDRSVNARAVHASCLWNQNRGADRVIARREMARLLEETSGYLLEQCADLLIRGCLVEKSWDEAECAIQLAEKRGLDSAAVFGYRAHLARAQGRLDEAKQFARAAKDNVVANPSRSARWKVANTLASVGLGADALPILESIASRTELTDETRTLLDCGVKAQRHDLVLEWCEALRHAGVRDDRLLETELGLLEKYDTARAVDVIEAALQASPQKQWLRVRRCLLGVRLKRPDLSTFLPDDAPSVGEVEAGYVQATVECLIQNNFHREAIDYAYRSMHYFPDEPRVSMALIRATLFVPADSVESVLVAPISACIGSVVEYREDGDSRTVHCAIEDGLPRAFPDMIDAASNLASLLLGHQVGDHIVLAPSSTRDRTATVLSIDNKYRYRMNDLLSSWQLKFPETPFLERIRMPSDPHTGQLDLAPIIKGLRWNRDRAKHAEENYRTGVVPISFLAKHVGRSVFETMHHLATEEDLFVNCAFVTADIHLATLQLLRRTKGLVLDETAIWTLHALDIVQILDRVPIPIGIVQPTLDQVRSAITEPLPGDGKKHGLLTLVGEKVGYIEVSADTERVKREHWEQIAATLERRCEVLGARLLASLDAGRRDDIEKFVGEGGAQAGAAAKQADYVLWTDDRVHEFLAKDCFGVERVWTQAVLSWLQETGAMSDVEFSRASARLEAFHYWGTWVNPEVLVEAGRLANWQVRSFMLQRSLRVLGDRTTVPANRYQMAMALILAVNKEVSLEASRDAVTLAVLEQLRDRPIGTQIIQELLRRLPQAMQLNPIRGHQVLETIRSWLLAEQHRWAT